MLDEFFVRQFMQSGNFVCFTIPKINYVQNSNGEWKKKPQMPKTWKEVNRENMYKHLFLKDDVLAVITGKIGGITGIDFDDQHDYELFVDEHPELKKCRTIKTKKGSHIYFQYDERFPGRETPFDPNSLLKKVDIRNDGNLLYAPPSSYKTNDGTIIQYEDLGGIITKIPEYFFEMLLPKYRIPNYQEPKILPSNTTKVFSPEAKISDSTDKEKKDIIFIKNALDKGLLNDYAMNATWHEWMKIALIFKHTSKSHEMYNLFLQFSQINSSKYDEKTTFEMWDGIKKPACRPLTIATLKKMILPKKEVSPEDEIPEDIIICEDNLEGVEKIFPEIKDKLKSCNGRIFFNHENVWFSDIIKIKSRLLLYVANFGLYKWNSKSKTKISYCQNVSVAKQIVELLLAKIMIENEDETLYNKFHLSTKGKLCFLDGVLDFPTKTFTLWDDIPPNTVFTQVMIKRNFKQFFDSPNRSAITEVEEKIFSPIFGENLLLAKQFYSRAVAGHNEDKYWNIVLSNRDSGKGVIFRLLKETFQDYINSFEAANMFFNEKTAGQESVDASKKSYWLLDQEFVRLAINQEVPSYEKTKLVLRASSIKRGGDDDQIARRNFDTHNTTFKIDCTFCFFCNNDIIAETDDCYETRVMFTSPTQFVSEEKLEELRNSGNYSNEELKRFHIRDDNIKTKCTVNTEWHNALVYLLLENYKTTPVHIKLDVQEEILSLYSLIKTKFEYSKGAEILIKEIYSSLEDQDKKKIQIELNSMGIVKIKSTSKENKNKWVYKNIAFKN